MNPIEEYYSKIESGEIVVGAKIRAVYKHVVTNMHDSECPYHYDEDKANRVITFCESYCRQSKGKQGGKPLKLLLWQKAMICTVFGMVDDDGYRQYKEALLVVARKCGKSCLASAIGLYCLMKDYEPGPQVLSAATKKEQARVIWDESVKMIKKSPALRKRCKTLVGVIKCEGNDGDFKPLSRDSNSLDGLNPSLILADECHAWTDMNLFDVLKDGQSARQQPLIMITTTAGFVRDGIYDRKYNEAKKIIAGYDDDAYIDERTFPLVYELDSPEEIWDENCWTKANPSIDLIKSREDLREKVYKAKADRTLLPNLLTKDFDVIQTSTVSYFGLEHLNHATFDVGQLKPDYCIGGFDLSRVMDLTAAVAIFQVPGDETIYVMSMFWMPEDSVEEHRHDNVPYQTWIDNGYIRLCHGNVIDDQMVVDWYRELRDKYDIYLFRCGYDRYSATHVQQEMIRNFGDKSMIPVAQGTKTLSIPMETSRALLEQKKINYDDNPVMNWCLLNVQAKLDVNGGVQPMKNRDLNVRIDGYAALLDALTVYLDNLEGYRSRIGY
jgi:phage terminase large subunit-like protein